MSMYGTLSEKYILNFIEYTRDTCVVGQTYSKPLKADAAFVKPDRTHSVRSKYSNLGSSLEKIKNN
jgi:hypothetical protein